MRFRLCKPKWAIKEIRGKKNPDFIKEILGPNVYEGHYEEEFLRKQNDLGYQIFFFPNYPSKDVKFASGKHIDVIEYVFVDMDLKSRVYKSKEEFLKVIRKFELKPCMIVDSGNGIHVYWNIKNLDKFSYCIIQLLLIEHFKTDDSIWTVQQIMRLPGFYNTKRYNDYINADFVDSVEVTDKFHTVNEMLSYLPTLKEEYELKARSHIRRTDGIVEAEDLPELTDLPDKFIQDMKKNINLEEIFKDPKSYKGDRSSADMKLCNMIYNLEYSRSEAEQVLLNTQKALERDSYHRQTYAKDTVKKVYEGRPEFYEPSASELTFDLKSNSSSEILVKGPKWFDCQEEDWLTGQAMGLVLGTGIGKTQISVDIVKHVLRNNRDNGGRAVYISLEMSKRALLRRWNKATRNELDLSYRLHIVDNTAPDGDTRSIGLQEIVWIVKDIEKATGDKVIIVVIDYIGELSLTIDTNKKPNFNTKGSQTELTNIKDPVKTLTYETAVLKVKDIAKITNTFVLMQSQTTKDLDGEGDKPIGKHGAYGTAKFANMVHWMLTAWQPLLRVKDQVNLPITAWQYCKMREQNENDLAPVFKPHLLYFDIENASFRKLTNGEMEIFEEWKPVADGIRKNAEKNGGEGLKYSNSPTKNKFLRLAMEKMDEME